jgi:hypothetical protein
LWTCPKEALRKSVDVVEETAIAALAARGGRSVEEMILVLLAHAFAPRGRRGRADPDRR